MDTLKGSGKVSSSSRSPSHPKGELDGTWAKKKYLDRQPLS